MKTPNNAFEQDLVASLDGLARRAPAGPDAAAMHRRLHRRRNRRVGLATGAVAAAVVAVVILLPTVPPTVPPDARVAVTSAPAATAVAGAPQPRLVRRDGSSLVMPTASFVSVAQPGPGAQGRLDLRASAMTMCVAPIRQTAGDGVTMNAPSISMPKF